MQLCTRALTWPTDTKVFAWLLTGCCCEKYKCIFCPSLKYHIIYIHVCTFWTLSG